MNVLMRIRSKTEITNLLHLQDMYLDMLQHKSRDVYAPYLENGVLTETEVNSDVMNFFERTKPILQSVYSYYEKYWHAYYELDHVSEDGFVAFLRRNQGRLAYKYDLVDLDVSYYIERYQTLRPGSMERRELFLHFRRKWRDVLTNDEFTHQMKKMDELCSQMCHETETTYERIKNRMKLGNGGTISRFHILLNRYSDEVVNAINDFLEISIHNPIVRTIVDELGRSSLNSNKCFASTLGINPEWVVRHSLKSDIDGISEGDDLNSLLPTEYCFATDPELQDVFIRRWTQKQLQTFDYVSHIQEDIKRTDAVGNQISEPSKRGPIVICLDTSGSMIGVPELVSKSIILAVAQFSSTLFRPLYVINFSESIETVSIVNFERDFGKLISLLTKSFYKGSNMNYAVEHAIEVLGTMEYDSADLLFLSDFCLDPMSPEVHADVLRQKERGTRIYSVSFKKETGDGYLDLSDRVWTFERDSFVAPSNW